MKKLFRVKFNLLQICCLMLIFVLQSTHLNAQASLKGLEMELSRLADLSGGKMGIGVIHLETDQRLYVNNNFISNNIFVAHFWFYL